MTSFLMFSFEKFTSQNGRKYMFLTLSYDRSQRILLFKWISQAFTTELLASMSDNLQLARQCHTFDYIIH